MIRRFSLAKFGGVPPINAIEVDMQRYTCIVDDAEIPEPLAPVNAPQINRVGEFDLWEAPGHPPLLTVPGVCTIHDWMGMVPVAYFDDEKFPRTLRAVNVYGQPRKVRTMKAVPGTDHMTVEMAEKLIQRRQWIDEWTREDRDYAVEVVKLPTAAPLLQPPCVYRGETMGDVLCRSCKGSVKIKTYHCSIFGSCNLGNSTGEAGKSCQTCNAREVGTGATEIIPFESFVNRYAGREGWIIGRGPTQFCGEELASVAGPVFFINDAVDWERYVTHRDTFFTALEWPKFSAYAWRIRSIAMMGFMNQHPADGIKRVVRFDHQFKHSRDEANPIGPLWHLLDQTREQLAQSRRLYQHGSTMLVAIHFAWFCGVTKLNLVGCDCLPTTHRDGRPATSRDPKEAYNPALPAATDDRGGVSGGIHPTLRRRHEEVMRRLGMRWEYLGTPSAT